MPAPPAAAALDHLRLLRLAGPDRADFLQGQLTQDLRHVTPARSALAGWATAQGKLLMTGQLLEWQDALWLTCPAALAEAIARRLRLFVLRARVSITVDEARPWGILGDWEVAPQGPGEHPLACASGTDWCATRLAGDPARVLLLAAGAAPPPTPGALEAWNAADVACGLPVLSPETSDRFIPQMLNLDLLEGIATDKGCYAGQEIINRTRHLGRVRRRLLRFACTGGTLPAPGATVFGPAREAGHVINAVDRDHQQELLAVVQLEEIGGGLYADEERHRPLRRLPLPYEVPGAP